MAEMENGSPISEAIDVSMLFGESTDTNRLLVLDILGPSGSGKSTLLRIMIGLLQPTSGKVLVHGQPLHGIHPGASLVFQNFALFPWLTVFDNIKLALNGLELSAAGGKDRIARCIDVVGLEGFE